MNSDPTIRQVLVDGLYLLALINPISKVSVLSILSSEEQREQFRPLILKSSATAAFILLGTMVFGDFVLGRIFHVQIHSLRIAGGFVLFWVGFNALRRGVFFERETKDRFEDLAMVPLACPMIAGPATIAACVTIRGHAGILHSAAAIALAVLANHFFMQMSKPISRLLSKYNILGALIRITGIIVMTIGTQMALDGLAAWKNAV